MVVRPLPTLIFTKYPNRLIPPEGKLLRDSEATHPCVCGSWHLCPKAWPIFPRPAGSLHPRLPQACADTRPGYSAFSPRTGWPPAHFSVGLPGPPQAQFLPSANVLPPQDSWTGPRVCTELHFSPHCPSPRCLVCGLGVPDELAPPSALPQRIASVSAWRVIMCRHSDGNLTQ